MTDKQLDELKAAWPGEWKSVAHSPQTCWRRLRGDIFVAGASSDRGEEFRSLGSNQTSWHATGETFAECLVQLKLQMRDSSRALRRRAEDIDHLLENMP